MKKFIIVLASIVSLLLVGALLIPIIFKDEIQKQVDKSLDTNLEAQVYFDPSKFGLTLFKKFPNPTISIEDFGIIGVDQFKGDTLLSVSSFNITIDLFSLFGDNYLIKAINLVEPKINVIVLENGEANYQIVADTESEDTTFTEETSSEFKLSIDQWEIADGRIAYVDKSLDFTMLLEGVNHKGSGDISLDIYDLTTYTDVATAIISYDGKSYLNGQKLLADATININMPEFKFTFKNNKLIVNDFPLVFEGFVAMPDEDIDMDITFSSANSSIKSLYSLVPGAFTEDYQGIHADGEMSFSGFVKGVYNENTMPAYNIRLLVSDGMLSYPDLPMPVTNIDIDMEVECKDGIIENTIIDIRKMHMDMGNNPFEGSLIIRNLKDYNMKADIQARIDLAELNSIFPMEGLDMKGIFSMDMRAEGIYDSVRNLMPEIAATMSLENGYIKSSEFPKALENISFKSTVECTSGKMEDMMINVEDFKILMEGEELNGNLVLKNLIDYEWDFYVNGDLDLEVFAEVYPIDGMNYSGHLKVNIETKGKYADVEAERYDRFPTKGMVELTDFNFMSNDLPQGMKITSSQVVMDPRQLQINSFNGSVGRSDLKLSGVIGNYMDYVFGENALLKGKMELNSNILDINEWMTGEETTPENINDTTQMELVAIPRNIDFEFNSSVKNIYYDNLNLQNARGLLTIKDGVLDMSNLSFDLFGGSIVMNGKYDTQQPQKPAFDYQVNIKSLSIPQAFTSFSIVQTFAPVAQHMNGNFSTNFNVRGLLKQDMSPVYESLNGKGLIQIAEAFVNESELVSALAGFMKTGLASNQLSLKDIIMKASIEGGRAYVAPFDIGVGGQKANVSGSIGADGSLDYHLSTEVEAGMIGQQVNQLLAQLKGQETSAASSKVKLNFNILGTYDKPLISLAGTTSADGTTTTLQEQVQLEVKTEVDKKVDEAKNEAERRVQEESEDLIKKAEEKLKPEIDTLEKKITETLKEDAKDLIGEELDSTANELKKSLQDLFKKKKNN